MRHELNGQDFLDEGTSIDGYPLHLMRKPSTGWRSISGVASARTNSAYVGGGHLMNVNS